MKSLLLIPLVLLMTGCCCFGGCVKPIELNVGPELMKEPPALQRIEVKPIVPKSN